MPLRGVKRFFEPKAGKTYAYHRASGTPIKAEWGTPAFAVELDKAERAWREKKVQDGTFGHLIDQYRAAPEFTRLKQRTRADYDKVFDFLEPLRAMPLDRLDRPFMVGLRNKAYAKHKRRFANYVVQVLSRACGIGIGLGLLKENPVDHVEKVRKATGEKSLNRPWTSAERDVVLAEVPAPLRGPFAMMRYLGVRLGDVRGMRRDAYQDGMISFVTGKGAVEVTVPCPEPLARILEAQPEHATHLFCSSDGSPWSEGGFHASWRRVRLRLEKEGKVKPGLTPHGLRHSVATDLRELGKTEREIADILGQRTTYAVPTYARSADMRRSNKRVIDDLYGEKEGPDGEGGAPDR
ncbi:tyrosine-type recombinase/integrase [Methylobacterium platani]|uniref:Tyr recombinase domain-containing protein n=1 Tax=Methylobacterium platani TaxID=427683 RepID=A0A179S7J2_9HYPH|nr:tyrosine-type recombinase/integrase [Methylobacterium platani]OAS22221.1 hypothetical protein A5481_19835 [Methylobacterium platani]